MRQTIRGRGHVASPKLEVGRFGEPRHVGPGGAEAQRERRTDGGREATWVGFRPGSARPSLGVTWLPVFLQAPCRKETPLASPAILEGRDPFSRGVGG